MGGFTVMGTGSAVTGAGGVISCVGTGDGVLVTTGATVGVKVGVVVGVAVGAYFGSDVLTDAVGIDSTVDVGVGSGSVGLGATVGVLSIAVGCCVASAGRLAPEPVGAVGDSRSVRAEGMSPSTGGNGS